MSSLPTPNQQPLRNDHPNVNAPSIVSSIQMHSSLRELLGDNMMVSNFCNSAETKVNAQRYLGDDGSHLSL